MYQKKSLNLDRLPPWLTLLKHDLDLKGVGVGIVNIPAGKGYTYLHCHERQEEVYIPVRGRGMLYVDKSLVLLKPGDFVKVPPESKRALKAEADIDLVCLIVGGVPSGFKTKGTSSTLINDGIPDWEALPPWYEGNEKIRAYNQQLRRRRAARNKTTP